MLLNDKRGDSKLGLRKKFLIVRVIQHWHRLPRAVVDPHPWKHSVSGWMGLWATCFGQRCPCSLQGHWTGWALKVLSDPNHPMTSWSYTLCFQRMFSVLWFQMTFCGIWSRWYPSGSTTWDTLWWIGTWKIMKQIRMCFIVWEFVQVFFFIITCILISLWEASKIFFSFHIAWLQYFILCIFFSGVLSIISYQQNQLNNLVESIIEQKQYSSKAGNQKTKMLLYLTINLMFGIAIWKVINL